MFGQLLVFVDVETTGSIKNGRMTEIACICVEGGGVVDRFVQLLNPKQFIPYHIQELTGIVNEMVEGKPHFEDIADQVEAITHDAVFVAHNVWFDYRFISKAFDRNGHHFTRDLLCTVQLTRKLFPDNSSHSLDTLIDRYDIAVDERHRAYADAKALHKLMVYLHESRSSSDIMNAINHHIIST